ncbi:AAA family ATPase [Candidatus Gracilibacteria bacterium]|nr:AAA family ATPase [Candidatus Gracilibacteria bacterium]
MIDYILHINGRGGSGKTTLVKLLNEKLGLQKTRNYTTRKPRFEGESEYHFVTEETFVEYFKQSKIIECYYKDSSRALYGTAAPEQTGIYQSEIVALVALKKWSFEHNVPFLSIYVDIDTQTLLGRLRNRSDTNETPEERLEEDAYYEEFKGWSDIVYDYNGKTVEQGVEDILAMMKKANLF